MAYPFKHENSAISLDHFVASDFPSFMSLSCQLTQLILVNLVDCGIQKRGGLLQGAVPTVEWPVPGIKL